VPRVPSTELKIPTKLPAVADLLYKTREERYALQKQVDELSKREAALSARLIDELPKDDATGIAGKVCRVEVVTKPTPTVENWDDLYKHIAKTKSFDLLQRRVSEAAVKERWEAKKVIPGVGVILIPKLSIHKI
jgi:hypothetical protein